MERDKRRAGQEAARAGRGGAWSGPRLSSLSARTSQAAPHAPCHHRQTHALINYHAAALRDSVQVAFVLTVCAVLDIVSRGAQPLEMRLLVLSLLLLLLLLDLRAGGEPPMSRARRRMSLRRHQHRTRGNTFRMMAEQPGRARPENRAGRAKCEATEEQTRSALHIVTARVEHVGPFTSRIKVRRVLKGVGLPKVVTISTCRVICCSLSKRDFRLFLLGRPETADGEDVFPQMAPPVGVSVKSLGRVKASTRGRDRLTNQ